ncbi:MAG: ATPase [Betaproteobacteria bacterium RIFCSPLOWO2_12_FULL_62_58]|nr:MAG: ATPase [Betaproteobacteria bacterium RIFCSPLOWO2_12_FULL_62_58]
MKITQLGVEEALASLRSGQSGLPADEAARRVQEYGPNRVETVAGESLLLRCGREFTHFFALILWFAAALAFFAEYREPGTGMGALGVAIVGVIFINGVFSFWQEYRAEKALAALRKLLPARVTVLRDGAAQRLPLEVLVPGDVILLQEGDEVPADCRLIEAFGVRVNDATLTGESLAQDKNTNRCDDDDPVRARNIALAGTLVLAGNGKGLVFATGMHTEFGKIAHLTQTARETLSPLQIEIARLSRLVAAFATLLGTVFFAIGQALELPFWENFIFAIGVIVANVPEGLMPTVTLSLAMATQRMARRNALVRHLPAVETLGATTVICSDKTGTLTQNRMEVTSFHTDGAWHDAVETADAAAIRAWQRPLFEVALRCHDLRDVISTGRREWLGDPMEAALRATAMRAIGEEPGLTRIDEVPFDSDRKRLSTLYQTPRGRILYCKGALESVLPLCEAVTTAHGTVALDAAARERVVAAEDHMAERGARVLALAYRPVAGDCPRNDWERGLILAGLVALSDPVRPEVPQAIATCRSAGIKVIMVTGDHPRTAVAVARRIGLVHSEHPLVITGEVLKRFNDAQLQLALDAPEIIFARVGANQKMVIVTALQRKNEIVAVTGDGVNDAPALKRADIGIAMAITGTDVAKESADMILLDDNFASIVAAIEEGRAVFDNIRKFLTYILTSNIPELVPYLAFVLFRIPLPLTIMQILAVDLGTDMLPALALGAEPPAPGGMHRPPRPRSERLLTWPLVARAYLFLGVLEAVAAIAAFLFVMTNNGWEYGAPVARDVPFYLEATAACLAAIVVMQVANVFLCRHPRQSAFAFGLRSNKLIGWGLCLELALLAAIIYTPLGNRIFSTAPLDAEAWTFILPFAAAMLLLEEGRKWLVRRFPTQRWRDENSRIQDTAGGDK